ncbi:molybdopterin-binding protein [Pedobacter sandarakinus]|uniref:hypothetical protein n=1 Tax=Pedobacter sandarakinus TaxID=353156 RepID=UPI002246BE7E|nr:hypothetical protein [Pedobacter sandarakinus]MCX2575377.1 hypothetical protein [Pedobacter sandarakinus]
MIKAILTTALILISHFGFSQTQVVATNEFTVSGLVDQPLKITYADLEKQKIVNIGDFKITNHLGEFKRVYKNVKGVSLLDLLKNLNIKATSPKLLSEYYLVLKASDGYSAVVSWNELFNTEIGNSFYLVVEADNKSQKIATEKILLISTKDFKTGRRHIKGLANIEIRRI